MRTFEFFRSTQITTDCDQCGGRVDMLKGGVCTRCRRILCFHHLHGSFVRRVIADRLGDDAELRASALAQMSLVCLDVALNAWSREGENESASVLLQRAFAAVAPAA